MTDISNEQLDAAHQLQLDLGIVLTPPKIEESKTSEDLVKQDTSEIKESIEQSSSQLTVAPTLDSCFMPTTLQASAQSSIQLRNVQQKLAEVLTNENYLSLLAATNPEILPQLLDSVTNAVSVSDNLMIQMARTAEKSSSINKVFDYMTRKLDKAASSTAEIEQKEDYYSKSIMNIKAAIYNRLDKERNAEPKTAKSFIDAEYTVSETSKDNHNE